MTWTISRSAALAAASWLAAALLAGSALADGMPKRGPARAPEPAPAARACTLSANVALTSDYIFRGFSQTAEGPAIQGGFEATCGRFYAGVFASSLDWGTALRRNPDHYHDNLFDTWAYLELDPYAGFKGKHGHIAWDVGVVYYGYPNSTRNLFLNPHTDEYERFRNEYLEIKAGLSGEVWKDGTLGATLFYSPDYQFETGSVWTLELGFAQALGKHWWFTPTFSALVGRQWGNDDDYAVRIANGDDGYTYWNAGLTLGFHEKWSIDLRYWDTSLGDDFCSGSVFQCDERYVATLKFAY
jgi:uncharacterized protein (TIGR02001 family)